VHFIRHKLRNKRAVIIYYSVCQKYQGRGLMKALLRKSMAALHDAGYTTVGVTWIADINQSSLRQIEILGGRTLHKTCLFRKAL
jgi:L-amino acid N-acyltransferase YncA